MANETVLFKRGDSATITSTPITDGQILFDTSGNGKMYLDNGTTRLAMGGSVTIDSTLSKTSTNAVQNKAVTGNILNSLAEVSAATQQNTIAGALALKEVNSSLASIKNNIVFYNPDDDYIYINGAKWRKANLINFVLLGDDYQNPDYNWISGNNEKITFTPNGRYHILNRILSGNTAIIWSDKNIDMSDYSKMVLRLQGISGYGQCIIGMTSKITTGTLTQSLSTYFDYSYQNSSHSGSSKVVETLEIDISSINTSVYIGLGIMDNPAQFLIMDLYLEQV